MKERDLYEPVRKFIDSEFDCLYSAIEKGSKAGRIDVIGIRNSIGDFGGDSELISIEVKPEKNTFLKSLGQAYAYSIMAEHCYLAVHKPTSDFSKEEKEQALKLGVGLIRINSKKKCSIVLSSPIHSPMKATKLALMNKLGFVQCIMCNAVFENTGMRSQRENSTIVNSINDGKPFRYWLENLSIQKKDEREYIYDRRHICADCVQIFKGLA